MRDAITDGALTPLLEAQVSAVERAISIGASLAAVYLEAGWTVELVARGCHVPAGQGRLHETKIWKALALLPYAAEADAFPNLPARVETVLVIPHGVSAPGRPAATTVMES